MKHYLVILFSTFSLLVHSQVNYSYDNAGNRQIRVTVSPPIMKPSTNNTNDPKAVDMAAHLGLSVYPNPSINTVNVNISSFDSVKSATVYMVDMAGNILYSKQVSQVPVPINITTFASGIYFVKVLIGENELYYRVIKP